MYTCIEKKIPQFCEDIKLSYAGLVVEIIVHSDQHVLRFVVSNRTIPNAKKL